MSKTQLLIEFGVLSEVNRMLWSVGGVDKARVELRDMLDFRLKKLREFDVHSPPVIVGAPLSGDSNGGEQ